MPRALRSPLGTPGAWAWVNPDFQTWGLTAIYPGRQRGLRSCIYSYNIVHYAACREEAEWCNAPQLSLFNGSVVGKTPGKCLSIVSSPPPPPPPHQSFMAVFFYTTVQLRKGLIWPVTVPYRLLLVLGTWTSYPPHCLGSLAGVTLVWKMWFAAILCRHQFKVSMLNDAFVIHFQLYSEIFGKNTFLLVWFFWTAWPYMIFPAFLSAAPC